MLSTSQLQESLEHLVQDCHDIAVEHGWWDTPRAFPELAALIHSEVSEALEEYRRWGDDEEITKELADIVIRVFDIGGAGGASLARAILDKIEVNRNRPYRHGGKRA